MLRTSDVQAARDELARRYLRDFACSVDIPTVPPSIDPETENFDIIGGVRFPKLADHHALICDKLDALHQGLIPNLMFLLPPGSAKSTYTDVVAVPHFMARKPRHHVILASYASAIAGKQGRRARQLIQQPAFERIHGVTLDPSKSAADEWMLTNGSEFMAGGILSGLTGNRAMWGILDDPIRGREAAESETIREKTWDAYVDDFCSRLVPGAPQTMILTRWHADDPAGRILPENWDGESGWFDGRDGRKWYVVCLPAIADRTDDPLGRKVGATLWPEWFSLEHWAPFQRNTRTWSSLYQQKPSPDEGTFLKGEWFDRYERRPQNLHCYMTSDHAPKGGLGSDWTVFNIWGVDHNQHLWLLDEFRSQDTIDVALGIEYDAGGNAKLTEEGGLQLIQKWKPLCWFPEDDTTWKASEGFVKAAMRRVKIHCRIEPLSAAGGDKPTKARPFQAMASMGGVHIPTGFMGDEILKEYKQFPAGKHDDRVDAAAHIGRALDMAHPAIVQATEAVAKTPNDRYHRVRKNAAPASAWG